MEGKRVELAMVLKSVGFGGFQLRVYEREF